MATDLNSSPVSPVPVGPDAQDAMTESATRDESGTGRTVFASRLSRLQVGETLRQTTMLFSAHTISSAISFVTNLVLVRAIDPAEMGRLSFSLTFIVISGLFVELGVFAAGSRMLALARSKTDERRTLGALVILGGSLCFIFALFVGFSAGAVDHFFKTDVRYILVTAAVLAFFQPFQWLVENTCQGLNQIRRLATFQLTISICYLLAISLLSTTRRLNAGTALVAYLIGLAVPGIWTIARLKPIFRGALTPMREMISEARSFGFNIYLSRITGTVSTRIDTLIIAYFLPNMATLGLYDVAQKLSNPMVTASRALGISRYRSFTTLNSIPSKMLKWNLIVLITAGLGLIVIGPPFLRYAFPKYAEASSLLIPFALYSLFSGLMQPYHAFLAAHRRSAAIRNIAITMTVITIVGLVVAVPRFGIMGAAWAAVAGMALDYGLHLLYYSKLRVELAKRP